MSLTLGQVQTNANLTPGQSITVKVDVNGTTIRNSTHTSSFTQCDTFTEKPLNTIVVTWTHNAGASIGIFSSSHTKGHAVCGHISTRQKFCSTTITSGTSPKTCDLSFGANVGIPNGTPTYLETLDKLDQWSSAHYVPHSDNALKY